MQHSYTIHIAGQVQGVGFRPYVFNLAEKHELTGYVSNNERGVVILVQGSEERAREFYAELIENPPPVSRITTHNFSETSADLQENFSIRASEKSTKLNLQLTPDFGICEQCRQDLKDSKNRRFNYAFTTCVNCGPRWSLTETFPFEREHTSMNNFDMCSACFGEYLNPSDRRFHSQTNSCDTCGIQLGLYDKNSKQVRISKGDLFNKLAQLLAEGNILAIKNTGGYLLCCDADNPEAIKRLRQKKRRPKKPFALLFPSMELLESELTITDAERRALSSTARPIVLIYDDNHQGGLARNEIAPGLNHLGVMLPYSGILELLSGVLTRPVVATSGNLHGSPILSNQKQAVELLDGVADFFVHHDLELVNPQDDSVLKFSSRNDQEVLFRRSRGFAPSLFGFHNQSDQRVLAMGSQLKSTLAFMPNQYLYVSQYLGHLDHYDVYERYLKTTERFFQIFEVLPQIILIDGHPGYQSSKRGKELSEEYGIPCHEIQHHEAHFASVLGENMLYDQSDPILGVVWDGTGYGNDGQIWGGEFFIYQNKNIERIHHLDYFDWLAGDKMAKEPRLSLLALCDQEMISHFMDKFTAEEYRIYSTMLNNNNLKTSSMGRLFDAIASMLSLCDHNTYEGEAAILMENSIDEYKIADCRSLLSYSAHGLSPKLLARKVYEELLAGARKEDIALNFLYTLATIIKEVALGAGVIKVALSGGVFQNMVLIDMINEVVNDDLEIYFNVNLAPNDENISHGQMMHYLNIEST